MSTYKHLLQNNRDTVFSEHEYEKTALKEMRIALQNLFKQLFDDKPYAIYVFDITSVNPKEYFLYMNEAVENITSYSRDEIMEHGYDFIISRWKEEEKKLIIDAHESFFSNLATLSIQEALQQVMVTYNHFLTKDDRWIQVVATGRAIRFFEKGQPHLMMITLQDGKSAIYPLPNIERELHTLTAPYAAQIFSHIDTNLQEIIDRQNHWEVQHIEEFLKRIAAKNLSMVIQDKSLLQFLSSLLRHEYDFTLMELKICMLIAMGMSSSTIAQTINLSQRTIENHRNHIRKKMGLLPSQNLTKELIKLLTKQP